MAEMMQSVDLVYHITPSDRLASLAVGLRPNPNRGKTAEWREREQRFDAERPDAVVELGISRRDAVFAHADSCVIDGIYQTLTSPDAQSERHLAAIAVMVDPESVLVCDAFLFTSWHSPKEYWSSALKLTDYRKYFNPKLYAGRGFSCMQKSDAPKGHAGAYLQPEVLVPGPIPTDRISLVAMSPDPLHPSVSWF
jgi:hypothetical protein